MPDAKTKPKDRFVRWHGIIGNGQSLSVGFQGDIPEPTAAAPGGLRLEDSTNTYDMAKPEAESLSVVPLTEPFRAQDGGADGYPGNIDGKTPHHSMACQISAMQSSRSKQPFLTVHSAVGKGGALMDDIRKNGSGNAYAASLYEAKALTRLANKQGTELVYDCIILTHGESDAIMNNEQYAEDVMQMQQDYAKDLPGITGQTVEPILILSQQSTSPPTWNLLPAVIDAMWRVQAKSDDKVVCAGPKYQYAYAPGELHLTASGYDRLGEKYGQAFFQTVVEGKPFRPLAPETARMPDARTVQVRFHVPVPPLQWDPLLPSPHQRGKHTAWAHGRGFEIRDAGGLELTIRDVEIDSGGDSVTIRLTSAPSHLPLTVAYAMTQNGEGFGPGFLGGDPDGRLGHLCDSYDNATYGAVTMECQMTEGSTAMSCSAGWQERAIYDFVDSDEYSIIGFDDQDKSKAYLSRPWTGASESRKLRFWHNQRNFLVSYIMPVKALGTA